IHSKDAGRDIDYFVVNDRESLRYVINLGTIPLHMWSSRLGSLDRPDWLVLDLDPKAAPFTDVIRVARALRRILDALELPSYVKTSGATGLHVLLPLGARYDDETTRTFARLLAVLGVEAEPAISTIVRPLKGRGGKVYIDWGQWPWADDRRAVLGAAAARRARVVSTPLGGGHRAARPQALHDQDGAAAPRGAR